MPVFTRFSSCCTGGKGFAGARWQTWLLGKRWFKVQNAACETLGESNTRKPCAKPLIEIASMYVYLRIHLPYFIYILPIVLSKTTIHVGKYTNPMDGILPYIIYIYRFFRYQISNNFASNRGLWSIALVPHKGNLSMIWLSLLGGSGYLISKWIVTRVITSRIGLYVP